MTETSFQTKEQRTQFVRLLLAAFDPDRDLKEPIRAGPLALEHLAKTDRARVVEAMEAPNGGGGFVRALAQAFARADSQNLLRLKLAFPQLWNTYAAKSERGPKDLVVTVTIPGRSGQDPNTIVQASASVLEDRLVEVTDFAGSKTLADDLEIGDSVLLLSSEGCETAEVTL